ncbi:hypothetical protein HPP92_006267 [Vanilla planifolia]|uniref:Uncharacterized protein n=1 Tax=Vanilla planifolia TaxID=51239 RepID=A0A835RPB9_VANPL|nr:hypothetical protein HPP92_006267 [Vanilla planifolia]
MGWWNWEIKTYISMKDIPQWELSGEVMPYMKTTDGAIPAIVADHIGQGREEFKKSLYGAVDGSSSDEDDSMSKSRKIRIRMREKPVDGPHRGCRQDQGSHEKQFRLGDAPVRTRSFLGISR